MLKTHLASRGFLLKSAEQGLPLSLASMQAGIEQRGSRQGWTTAPSTPSSSFTLTSMLHCFTVNLRLMAVLPHTYCQISTIYLKIPLYNAGTVVQKTSFCSLYISETNYSVKLMSHITLSLLQCRCWGSSRLLACQNFDYQGCLKSKFDWTLDMCLLWSNPLDTWKWAIETLPGFAHENILFVINQSLPGTVVLWSTWNFWMDIERFWIRTLEICHLKFLRGHFYHKNVLHFF